MDSSEKVIVDFVFPQESEITAKPTRSPIRISRLGNCTGCGGEKYILASTMGGDAAKGIPASQMYECADCGTYRLG